MTCIAGFTGEQAAQLILLRGEYKLYVHTFA